MCVWLAGLPACSDGCETVDKSANQFVASLRKGQPTIREGDGHAPAFFQLTTNYEAVQIKEASEAWPRRGRVVIGRVLLIHRESDDIVRSFFLIHYLASKWRQCRARIPPLTIRLCPSLPEENLKLVWPITSPVPWK